MNSKKKSTSIEGANIVFSWFWCWSLRKRRPGLLLWIILLLDILASMLAFLKKTFCIVCGDGWGPFERKICKIQSLVSKPARHPSILSIEKGWRGVGWNNDVYLYFFLTNNHPFILMIIFQSFEQFRGNISSSSPPPSSPSPLHHRFNVGTLLGLFEFPHSICVCFMPALWHHHNRHHYHLHELNPFEHCFQLSFSFFCTLNLIFRNK